MTEHPTLRRSTSLTLVLSPFASPLCAGPFDSAVSDESKTLRSRRAPSPDRVPDEFRNSPGCFVDLEASDRLEGGLERLAAVEEVRPGILLREALPEVADVELRGLQRRLHFGPGERRRNGRARRVAGRVRRNDRLREAVAEGIEIDAAL